MSDFTGQELAAILKREERQGYRLHRLTITKVLDRKALANALRSFVNLSVIERLKLVDNLPYINEELFTEESTIEMLLNGICEYTYEVIPFPGNENASTPPWESPEYISAKKWYNSLPEEDRKKIDILVQANIPWA